MKNRLSYRCRAFGFPLLGVVYIGIALIPPPAGSQEIFPFFNWSLFSQTSDDRMDAIAIIHEINGQPVKDPTSFYNLPEQFSAAGARDPSFMKLIDQLALAIKREDEEKIGAARDLVEQHYMREASSVKYEIAIARYHPVERYKNQKLNSVEVLGRFVKK